MLVVVNEKQKVDEARKTVAEITLMMDDRWMIDG